MAVVTRTELENASLDCKSLDDVLNGSAALNGTGLVSTREGTILQTIKKITTELAELDIGESAAAQLNTRMDALEATNVALEARIAALE